MLRAFGMVGDGASPRDLSDIAGTWQADPKMDQVFEEQRRVDPQEKWCDAGFDHLPRSDLLLWCRRAACAAAEMRAVSLLHPSPPFDILPV